MNIQKLTNDAWKQKASRFAIIKNILLLIIVVILIKILI
mgnify:CR=1 FL=1